MWPPSLRAQPQAAYKASPTLSPASPVPPQASSRDRSVCSAAAPLSERHPMRSLWLCWALWALPLPGPGAALSGEHILSTLLRQLQLREAPVLDAGDVEELVTPAHVVAQYVALLQRSHGVRSRGKRFSQRFRGEEPLPPGPGPAGGGRGEDGRSLFWGRQGRGPWV